HYDRTTEGLEYIYEPGTQHRVALRKLAACCEDDFDREDHDEKCHAVAPGGRGLLHRGALDLVDDRDRAVELCFERFRRSTRFLGSREWCGRGRGSRQGRWMG